MQPHKTVNDETLTRLHALTDRLTECLVEAEDVRSRLTKARDANVWPDLQPASRVLMDYNRSRRAH